MKNKFLKDLVIIVLVIIFIIPINVLAENKETNICSFNDGKIAVKYILTAQANSKNLKSEDLIAKEVKFKFNDKVIIVDYEKFDATKLETAEVGGKNYYYIKYNNMNLYISPDELRDLRKTIDDTAKKLACSKYSDDGLLKKLKSECNKFHFFNTTDSICLGKEKYCKEALGDDITSNELDNNKTIIDSATSANTADTTIREADKNSNDSNSNNSIDISLNETDCDSLLGSPSKPDYPAYYIHLAFTTIKYAAIILLVVFTMYDFGMATISKDEDVLHKATRTAVKRLILAIVIFVAPILIEYLLELSGVIDNPELCGISK